MSKIEWIPCEGCKARGSKWITHDPGTDDERVSLCTCFKDYQKKLILLMNLKKAGIPESIMDYNSKSYKGEKSIESIRKIRMFAKNFHEKYSHTNLYIHGPNSTQKTTIAHWVGMKLVEDEKTTVCYTLMDKVVKDLISCNYGEREEELSKTVEQYRDSDCLIIDECFDKRKMTLYQSGWQLSFLDSFLRERMEQNKRATIFISNIDLSMIEGTFGVGMLELVKRNCANSIFLLEDKIDVNDFDLKDMWKEEE